jgi:hypothetical protein
MHVVNSSNELFLVYWAFLRKKIFEAFGKFLTRDDFIHAFLFNPHMTDAKANISSTIDIYSQTTSSPELIIQIEDLFAGSHKVFGIFE